MMEQSVWIGFDPREAAAFAVAVGSARKYNRHLRIHGIDLRELRASGLYRRPTSAKDGRLWDDISEAPMATEFAISRFLVPHLARSGLALFMDCDMLVRGNLARLFDQIDRSKAVSVVKHRFDPPEGVKMDGQLQLRYARKNWSSVCVFNVGHPSNAKLTVDLINTVPGRDLHAFCWLEDDEIGEIGPEWNYLVGHHSRDEVPDPKIVHHTDGVPFMAGYENAEFAEEWWAELRRWTTCPF